MTDDRMALIDLIEKGVGGDLVCDVLAYAAERIDLTGILDQAN